MPFPLLPGLGLSREGKVGWLEFDRPDAGNAFDAQMLAGLPVAWGAFMASDVEVVVVTGAGRAFQTGLDMKQLSRDPAALKAMSRRTRAADLQMTTWHLGLDLPVVAAVNGVCAGGGLHFVVDADVVIASSDATFLDPHVSVGQVSAYESIGLARRGSFGDAALLAFTGSHHRITAERARQVGWVGEVVPPDQLLRRAQVVAEEIAAGERDAVRSRKRALWRAQEVGRTAAMREAAP